MNAADIHDQKTVAFAEKVTVTSDQSLIDHYPATVPARVIVETQSGRFETFVERPWGEPGGPIGRADLIAKFQALAAPHMQENRATAIIAAVENIKEDGVAPLSKLISAPVEL